MVKQRDWWLAAGAVTAALGPNMAGAQTADRAGITSAVRPATTGVLGAGPARVLVVGSDVFRNERITTEANGQAHLLFLDQSALTLGPSSEVILDRFVFDPDSGVGQLAMSASRGVFRFIGGQISKNTPVTVRTATSTIGVRGGTLLIDMATPEAQSGGPPSVASVFMLYGEQTTIQSRDPQGNPTGSPTSLAAGYFVNLLANQTVSPPVKIQPSQLTGRLQRLRAPNAGAPNSPVGQGATTTLSSTNSSLPPGSTAPNRLDNESSASSRNDARQYEQMSSSSDTRSSRLREMLIDADPSS